jgi:PDZ domain-containing protein
VRPMRRALSPFWIGLSGVAVLVVAFVVLWLVPSNDYIFLPDRAHPVDPLVRVQGADEPRDSAHIYFVDIFVRKASLIERLWPGIHEGAELVPKSALLAPGVSEQQRIAADEREMTRSQQIAAAVALRAAGYRVRAEPTGVLVEQVASDVPAAGKLLPTDVIVGVANKRVRSPTALRRIVGSRPPGRPIRLSVRRGSHLVQVDVRTVADPNQPGHAIIGIFVGQAAFIKLPRQVTIHAGNVGGPSAGLAFALDVLEQLGKDVDHGRRVAAIGQLELDGTVTAVGGLEQKTIGVRRSGIHFFLVPAGENAAEARRFAHGVRILPVHSFRQALRSLATLSKSAA